MKVVVAVDDSPLPMQAIQMGMRPNTYAHLIRAFGSRRLHDTQDKGQFHTLFCIRWCAGGEGPSREAVRRNPSSNRWKNGFKVFEATEVWTTRQSTDIWNRHPFVDKRHGEGNLSYVVHDGGERS